MSELVRVSEIRLVCFNLEDAPLPIIHLQITRGGASTPLPAPAPLLHFHASPGGAPRPRHIYAARTAAGGAAIELYSIWLSQIVTTQVSKPLSRDVAMKELPRTWGIIESQKDSIDAMPEGQALL